MWVLLYYNSPTRTSSQGFHTVCTLFNVWSSADDDHVPYGCCAADGEHVDLPIPMPMCQNIKKLHNQSKKLKPFILFTSAHNCTTHLHYEACK